MIIRYSNGNAVNAILLRRTDASVRVEIQGADDAADFRQIGGTWISEDCEPVQVEFASMCVSGNAVPTINDCICSHEPATRLVQLLLSGEDATEAAAAANRLYSASACWSAVADYGWARMLKTAAVFNASGVSAAVRIGKIASKFAVRGGAAIVEDAGLSPSRNRDSSAATPQRGSARRNQVRGYNVCARARRRGGRRGGRLRPAGIAVARRRRRARRDAHAIDAAARPRAVVLASQTS
jgi:hypothetical protein